MPSYKTGGKENGPGGERSLGHTEVQSDTGLSNGSLVSLAALLILPFFMLLSTLQRHVVMRPATQEGRKARQKEKDIWEGKGLSLVCVEFTPT